MSSTLTSSFMTTAVILAFPTLALIDTSLLIAKLSAVLDAETSAAAGSAISIPFSSSDFISSFILTCLIVLFFLLPLLVLPPLLDDDWPPEEVEAPWLAVDCDVSWMWSTPKLRTSMSSRTELAAIKSLIAVAKLILASDRLVSSTFSPKTVSRSFFFAPFPVG